MATSSFKNIDEYIATFPQETRFILQEIREFIRKMVPEAEEAISYGMPAFNYRNTYLVYFAGYRKHIGFYPVPTGMEAFKKELSGYKTGKGSVQVPLDQPMPYELMSRIIAFRLKEIDERAGAKIKAKKGSA